MWHKDCLTVKIIQRLVMGALSFHHLISFTRKNPRFANSLKMKSEFKFEEVLPKLRDVIIQIKSTDVPPHSIIQDQLCTQ